MALLTADGLLHIAVLVWLVSGTPSQLQRARPLAGELAMFDVSASPASGPAGRQVPQPKRSPEPALARVPREPAIQPQPASVEQQVAAILGDRAALALSGPPQVIRASTGLPAASCDLTAPVEAAIRAYPEAVTGPLRLPRASVSIANAYMLWNTSWIAPRHASADALAPIRAIIAANLATASDDCLDTPQIGPRFIVVGPSESQLTLVIGSGQWRWRDLVTSLADNSHQENKNTGTPTT